MQDRPKLIDRSSIGGVLRRRQAIYGDILVALGGGPGTEHLAQLYMTERKPVIPFDISLKKGELSAAERLSILAMETPERFFEYTPLERACAAYSIMSLKNELPDVEELSGKFFELCKTGCS